MPDLGKATYVVELDTRQVSKIKGAQAEIEGATTGMNEQLTLFEEKVTQAGAATATAADEIVVAADKAVTSSKKVGTEGAVGWEKFRASAVRAGEGARRATGLLGLGAAYLVVKSGISTLKDNNAAQLQLAAAIKTTGGVAGVTSAHALGLSKRWEEVAGTSRAATNSMVGVLLSFTNLRNVAGKGNDVFDRTVAVVENISAKLGKGLQPTAIAVGKALQDPVKYMSALARTGVTFTKAQSDMVKQLVATKGPLAAQRYLLSNLEHRYNGAAKAAGDSFAGQLNRAKLQLGEASAKMVTAFIPTFKTAVRLITQLGTVLSHHTTLVKNLVIAFIAWKAATVALEIVIKLAKATQILWNAAVWMGQRASRATKVAMEEQAVATTGVATAEEGAIGKTAVLKAGLMGLAKIGVITIGIALVAYGAHKIAQSILHLQSMAAEAQLRPTSSLVESKLAKRYGEEAEAMRAKGMRGAAIEAQLFKELGGRYAQSSDIVAAALVYASGSDKRIAAARRAVQAKQLHTQMIKQHYIKPPKKGKVKPPSGSDVTGGGSTAITSAAISKIVPPDILAAVSKAKMTASIEDDKTALKREENYLRSLLHNHKLSATVRAGIIADIASVNSKYYAVIAKAQRADAAAKAKAARERAKAARERAKVARAAAIHAKDLQTIKTDKNLLHGAPARANLDQVAALLQEQKTYRIEAAGISKRIHSAKTNDHERASLYNKLVAVTDRLEGIKKGLKTARARVAAAHRATLLTEALLRGGSTGTTAAAQARAQAVEMKTYRDDATNLRKRIKAAQGNWIALAPLTSQLLTVQNKIQTLRDMAAQKKKANANARLGVALDKALLANDKDATKRAQSKILKAEIAAYTADEDGLKKQLRAKGLSYVQQKQILDQILSVDKKILALKKKAGIGLSLDQKEMQSLLDTQGTYMSDFAGNVFGKTAGGLSISSPTAAPTMTGPSTAGSSHSKHLTVNQHNHYEEIPKDRFREAHRLRKATAESMNFGR